MMLRLEHRERINGQFLSPQICLVLSVPARESALLYNIFTITVRGDPRLLPYQPDIESSHHGETMTPS